MNQNTTQHTPCQIKLKDGTLTRGYVEPDGTLHARIPSDNPNLGAFWALVDPSMIVSPLSGAHHE